MTKLDETEREELERLRALINTPHYGDFWEAVKIEAAHQRERWGEHHDRDKHPWDFLAVWSHLSGKFVNAVWNDDRKKMEHHIITLAATAMNFHRILITR